MPERVIAATQRTSFGYRCSVLCVFLFQRSAPLLSSVGRDRGESKIRVALISLYTPGIHEYAKYGLATKRYYCDLHGYDFHVYSQSLEASRPPAWSKILAIEAHLTNYDWVFWTDADSLIMNPRLSVERIVSGHQGKDMVLSRGHVYPINTGQWLIRNCDWSSRTLRQVWDGVGAGDPFLTDNPWEQEAFQRIVDGDPDAAKRLGLQGTRSLNARPSNQYIDMFPGLPELEYKDGDFVVHFYHSKAHSRRTTGMRTYYERWVSCVQPPSRYLLPRKVGRTATGC